MICPACGARNRDEAAFCKACGADLRRTPGPAGRPTAPVVMRPVALRPWWHAIGVFVLVAVGLLVIDVAANGRVTWSLVVVLAVAFIVGGILMLQVLAAPEPRDRRPFVAGAVLLAAAVLLLPVAVALQSTATYTETYVVPSDPSVSAIAVTVADETGHVTVGFAKDPPYLVEAQVTHIGGVFSSHYPGDLTVTNATAAGTLTFTVRARTASGLFFLGGHDIDVTVNERLAATLALSSTTGSLTVDVPAGALIGAGGITASVTTGDVSIRLTNADYLSGATVQAMSTTGSVGIEVVQSTVRAGTVPVQGTSTTGSVSWTFSGASGVAARVASTVTTGAVHYDAAKYTGSSPALLYAPSSAGWDAAAMKFDVSLASTTGGVTLG